VNLAVELGRIASGQTLLVDLHLLDGDAAVMLGAEPRFTVLDALQNAHRLDDAVLRGLVTPTSAGIDLLAASNSLDATVTLSSLPQLVASAARLYRYVVLDLPRAGYGTLDVLPDLARIVVVSNQELSTIRHTTALVAALQRRIAHERVSVVVSRFDPQSDIRREDIEKVVKVSIKHTVPSDYRLAMRAQNAGRPLTLDNHSRLAGVFRDLSRDLAGIMPPAVASASAGLFGRFSGRRS
jgi:pilus assembly protein CpaE